MSSFKLASSHYWRYTPLLTASALSLTFYTAHLHLRPALTDDTLPRVTEAQPRSSQADVAKLRSIPVCIVTANPDEAENLQSKMKGTWARVRDVEILGVHGGLTFFTGQVMGKDGAAHAAYITSCTRPGTQTFAIECSSLLRALKPQYAVHVGVCTVPNENIGDVVLGDAAYNYDEEPEHWRLWHCPTELEYFVNKQRNATWHYGYFMSGLSARVDAAGFFAHGQTFNRLTRALDRESSAFLEVCELLGVRCLGVIKGVSAHGDTEDCGIPHAYTRAIDAVLPPLEGWLSFSVAPVESEHATDSPEVSLAT